MTFKTNVLQESSDKSVIELQQYAKKNKPNLHILNKLQEEMRKLAKHRVRIVLFCVMYKCTFNSTQCMLSSIITSLFDIDFKHVWKV